MKHIKGVIETVTRYEEHFRSEMRQRLKMQSEETVRICYKKLAQNEKRVAELDRLFLRIYEDNTAGRLSDERFSMMCKTYEGEQAELKIEVENLKQTLESQAKQRENIEQFIERVNRYVDLDELTPYALRELVKAIYVEAPDKSSGKRTQAIHISYDLVGYIPLDVLKKTEKA